MAKGPGSRRSTASDSHNRNRPRGSPSAGGGSLETTLLTTRTPMRAGGRRQSSAAPAGVLPTSPLAHAGATCARWSTPWTSPRIPVLLDSAGWPNATPPSEGSGIGRVEAPNGERVPPRSAGSREIHPQVDTPETRSELGWGSDHRPTDRPQPKRPGAGRTSALCVRSAHAGVAADAWSRSFHVKPSSARSSSGTRSRGADGAQIPICKRPDDRRNAGPVASWSGRLGR